MGNDPFITRLPASYNAHSEAVDAALKADKWETIGTLNQTTTSSNRPAAEYKINELAALRPAVIARKVSQCSRTATGAGIFEAMKVTTQVAAKFGNCSGRLLNNLAWH